MTEQEYPTSFGGPASAYSLPGPADTNDRNPVSSSPIALPAPSGHDPDGMPYWRLSDGQRVYAMPGSVYSPSLGSELENIEADALAHLAAAGYARETREV